MIVDGYWQKLDLAASESDRFAALLTSEEQRQASRFHFALDRWRYVVRRGRLRELLAERLDCSPRQVPLLCNSFGKPFVDGADLPFSLSHSQGLALYVIGRTSLEIGCDIEWRRSRLASKGLARQFFSPLEVKMLSSLPADRWAEGFFNCWTRKEAYVKGRGLGLSCPLAGFVVSLAPGEPAALLRGEAGWALRSFEPVAGLHVAIAAHGKWRLASRLPPVPPGFAAPAAPVPSA